jgi:phage terminase small subunit
MRTGRPPKPTALKILQGTARKHRLPKNEPVPPPGEIVKPRMRRGASAIWDTYAPMVIHMGLLTPVDVPLFALACALMAEAARNPGAMASSRIARLESLSGKFGLSPSDRARLGSVAKPKENAFGALTA